MKTCVTTSGEVAVSESAENLYLYRDHLYYKQRVGNAPCTHDYGIHLHFGMVNAQEYIFKACCDCRKIFLINARNIYTNYITAFQGDVGPMCAGADGSIYTVHNTWDATSGHVSIITQLNTRKPKFELEYIFPQAYHVKTDNIQYSPENRLIILNSNTENRICAVSSYDGRVFYQARMCKIDNEMFRPSGLVCVNNVLIVGDLWNSRIVCIKPSTGQVQQVIPLKEVTGSIWNLQMTKSHLVVQHSMFPNAVSFYKVSCILMLLLFSNFRELNSIHLDAIEDAHRQNNE